MDQLATPSQLNLKVQDTLDEPTAVLLIEGATAVVQEAAGGQRILQVIDDVATLVGSYASELNLPQLPVTAVSAVLLDGTPVTAGVAGSGTRTYRKVGNSLWRGCGWQSYRGEPSEAVITYTHGYPPEHQELAYARDVVLMLAAAAEANPTSAGSVKIDDFAAAYDAASRQMTDSLRNSLLRKYGRAAGLVHFG